MTLLSISQDAKTVKGEKYGYKTAILYLSPADVAVNTLGLTPRHPILDLLGFVGRSVCPFSTPGCREACLYTAGRARIFPAIHTARLSRTRFLLTSPLQFLTDLRKEIKAFVASTLAEGARPAVRLNGTSDLKWWEVIDPREFGKHVRFYDYTKRPRTQVGNWLGHDRWHLTYSMAETNASKTAAADWQANGGSYARVLRKRWMVEELLGAPNIVDGDAHDLRFLDPPGSIVLLKAKGRAAQDKTGFVGDFNAEA